MECSDAQRIQKSAIQQVGEPALRGTFLRLLAKLAAIFATGALSAFSQELQLPPRPPHAPTGSEFARQIQELSLTNREQQIVSQILSGNIPNFLRKLQPVQVTNSAQDKTNAATFFVTPDYLAVGSDDDYFLTPISPGTAQLLADRLSCSLPTRKMVNDIYNAAEVKLAPLPIPPSSAMTSVEVFEQHNSMVRTQRLDLFKAHPLGALVAGHQKDVVISTRLANSPGKVAIYGWHQTNGAAIQPLYLGHAATWVDYSQCSRLALQAMSVNGSSNTISGVLADPSLSALLSDEGVVASPRYADPGPFTATDSSLSQFVNAPFNERTASFVLDQGVKVHINAPSEDRMSAKQKTLLIFYALPNGNTTAQTIGKATDPTENPRFNIQHIGAQTRFLRALLRDTAVVVTYLENDLLSWPSWRKKYGDKSIPEILSRIQSIVSRPNTETVLSGHSGGGSLIFGYLNSVDAIPDEVVRIAFLDSNYAYDPALGHKSKLTKWLGASTNHFLSVLAYDDASALLDGKPFVSAKGGTWGRSQAMLSDFEPDFHFASSTNSTYETRSALDGRIQFLLKPNPEKKIYHTIQVELNGFIQAMVSGTPNEGKGYSYFGPRAYTNWIATGTVAPNSTSRP